MIYSPISINSYTINNINDMKVQRSITIDNEVNEILKKRPTLNVSALVNDLLKKHLEEKQ